ncbi:hypothetical protein K503DRAFT_782407 [Rhizopogon vinicolor AM-OR11-026]|uniref:Uncharacterized protein n=1 Tax=Rhizopogon vinicolor AM-OR11-026 TaxID=1314800 RepID=A0A1B7N2J9_9AGAM|nr:hypothetical protein K503DRAFT_782407 [Rhizopogon vinicolor AM-OR11-026]
MRFAFLAIVVTLTAAMSALNVTNSLFVCQNIDREGSNPEQHVATFVAESTNGIWCWTNFTVDLSNEFNLNMKSPMGLDIRLLSPKANRKHVFFIPSSHLSGDNSLGFMLQDFALSVFLHLRSAHGRITFDSHTLQQQASDCRLLAHCGFSDGNEYTK